MEVGVVVSFTGIFVFFFARKVDFGAKSSREETQEEGENGVFAVAVHGAVGDGVMGSGVP